MTIRVSIEEAQRDFAHLILNVRAGEEVLITDGEQVIARLVPPVTRPTRRVPGTAVGQFVVPEDFDAPLPDEVLRDFELSSG